MAWLRPKIKWLRSSRNLWSSSKKKMPQSILCIKICSNSREKSLNLMRKIRNWKEMLIWVKGSINKRWRKTFRKKKSTQTSAKRSMMPFPNTKITSKPYNNNCQNPNNNYLSNQKNWPKRTHISLTFSPAYQPYYHKTKSCN